MSMKKVRFTLTLDDKLLGEIDDFRFENRFENRTQATLELIRIGLKSCKTATPKNKEQD